LLVGTGTLSFLVYSQQCLGSPSFLCSLYWDCWNIKLLLQPTFAKVPICLNGMMLRLKSYAFISRPLPMTPNIYLYISVTALSHCIARFQFQTLDIPSYSVCQATNAFWLLSTLLLSCSFCCTLIVQVATIYFIMICVH
jgi:hypothetical protein